MLSSRRGGSFQLNGRENEWMPCSTRESPIIPRPDAVCCGGVTRYCCAATCSVRGGLSAGKLGAPRRDQLPFTYSIHTPGRLVLTIISPPGPHAAPGVVPNGSSLR